MREGVCKRVYSTKAVHFPALKEILGIKKRDKGFRKKKNVTIPKKCAHIFLGLLQEEPEMSCICVPREKST